MADTALVPQPVFVGTARSTHSTGDDASSSASSSRDVFTLDIGGGARRALKVYVLEAPRHAHGALTFNRTIFLTKMIKHGAQVESSHYRADICVYHPDATDSEIRYLCKRAVTLRQPVDVVHPDWADECIKAGELLSGKDPRWNCFTRCNIDQEQLVSQSGPGLMQGAQHKPTNGYSRNKFSNEDREMILEYMSENPDMSPMGRKIGEALAKLNPRHSSTSYQTWISQNYSTGFCLKRKIEKLRLSKARSSRTGGQPALDAKYDSSSAEVVREGHNQVSSAARTADRSSSERNEAESSRATHWAGSRQGPLALQARTLPEASPSGPHRSMIDMLQAHRYQTSNVRDAPLKMGTNSGDASRAASIQGQSGAQPPPTVEPTSSFDVRSSSNSDGAGASAGPSAADGSLATSSDEDEAIFTGSTNSLTASLPLRTTQSEQNPSTQRRRANPVPLTFVSQSTQAYGNGALLPQADGAHASIPAPDIDAAERRVASIAQSVTTQLVESDQVGEPSTGQRQRSASSNRVQEEQDKKEEREVDLQTESVGDGPGALAPATDATPRAGDVLGEFEAQGSADSRLMTAMDSDPTEEADMSSSAERSASNSPSREDGIVSAPSQIRPDDQKLLAPGKWPRRAESGASSTSAYTLAPEDPLPVRPPTSSSLMPPPPRPISASRTPENQVSRGGPVRSPASAIATSSLAASGSAPGPHAGEQLDWQRAQALGPEAVQAYEEQLFEGASQVDIPDGDVDEDSATNPAASATLNSSQIRSQATNRVQSRTEEAVGAPIIAAPAEPVTRLDRELSPAEEASPDEDGIFAGADQVQVPEDDGADEEVDEVAEDDLNADETSIFAGADQVQVPVDDMQEDEEPQDENQSDEGDLFAHKSVQPRASASQASESRDGSAEPEEPVSKAPPPAEPEEESASQAAVADEDGPLFLGDNDVESDAERITKSPEPRAAVRPPSPSPLASTPLAMRTRASKKRAQPKGKDVDRTAKKRPRHSDDEDSEEEEVIQSPRRPRPMRTTVKQVAVPRSRAKDLAPERPPAKEVSAERAPVQKARRYNTVGMGPAPETARRPEATTSKSTLRPQAAVREVGDAAGTRSRPAAAPNAEAGPSRARNSVLVEQEGLPDPRVSAQVSRTERSRASHSFSTREPPTSAPQRRFSRTVSTSSLGGAGNTSANSIRRIRSVVIESETRAAMYQLLLDFGLTKPQQLEVYFRSVAAAAAAAKASNGGAPDLSGHATDEDAQGAAALSSIAACRRELERHYAELQRRFDFSFEHVVGTVRECDGDFKQVVAQLALERRVIDGVVRKTSSRVL